MGRILKNQDLKIVDNNFTELKIDICTQFKFHCEYQAGKRSIYLQIYFRETAEHHDKETHLKTYIRKMHIIRKGMTIQQHKRPN